MKVGSLKFTRKLQVAPPARVVLEQVSFDRLNIEASVPENVICGMVYWLPLGSERVTVALEGVEVKVELVVVVVGGAIVDEFIVRLKG